MATTGEICCSNEAASHSVLATKSQSCASMDKSNITSSSNDLSATMTSTALRKHSNSLSEVPGGEIPPRGASRSSEAVVGVEEGFVGEVKPGKVDGISKGRMQRTLRRMRMAGLGFQVWFLMRYCRWSHVFSSCSEIG